MTTAEITQLAIKRIEELGSFKNGEYAHDFNLQGHACELVMFAAEIGCPYEALNEAFEKNFN